MCLNHFDYIIDGEIIEGDQDVQYRLQATINGDPQNPNNIISQGFVDGDNNLQGFWSLNGQEQSKGDIRIRKANRADLSLQRPGHTRLDDKDIQCICKLQLKNYVQTRLNKTISTIYANKMEPKNHALQQCAKIAIGRSKANFARAIFRKFFENEQLARESSLCRKNHDYRWFELYYLDENDLWFRKKEILELYIQKDPSGKGSFHEMKVCQQSRQIQYNQASNSYEETYLVQKHQWAFKRVLKSSHAIEVYKDIIIQYLARRFAQKFMEIVKRFYPDQEIQFDFIQPYVAVPLFSNSDQCYYEIESFLSGGFAKFSGLSKDGNFEHAQMTGAFTHWTALVSGAGFMITDLQGMRIDNFKFVLTDPLMHSFKKNQFGKTDHGQEDGMTKWFKTHKCNEICKKLGLNNKSINHLDIPLIMEFQQYLNKFNSNSEGFQNQLEFIIENVLSPIA
ncbi:elongation factor 2 [Stylonychia lemnae]|uniref:Elongation factor 2 n=1 Tax=Stylonychia lemnae TaxID=5949 RepID=A0A078A6F3_STYLE|nr:elongation factor 2 [Stylonychia lemnae]|eukprot:CDW77784.1 elongation factor 2 [Stylonychia lemnae]